MKERLTRKKLSTWLGILAILGLLIGVVLLAAIIYVAADAMKAAGWNTTFMQYVEYVILIIAGILIVRHWMTEYEYSLVDDELIIDRYIGRNPRNLLCIKLSSIVSVSKQEPDIKKKDKLTFRSKSKGVTYIVYKQNGEQKCMYFSPSDELLSFIEERRVKR
jgi:hypothetical protein